MKYCGICLSSCFDYNISLELCKKQNTVHCDQIPKQYPILISHFRQINKTFNLPNLSILQYR